MASVSADERAGHSRDLKTAELCQHVDRILRVRMIDPDGAFDRRGLSFQACVRKSGPPAGHFTYRPAQQNRRDRTGRRCVSDTHLPDDSDPVSLPAQFLNQVRPGLQCLLRLLPRHGRSFGDVCRSRADPAADRSVHFRQHAHIHRDHVSPGRFRHQVDIACPLYDAPGHQCRHLAAGLAHAFTYHAVVSAEHQGTSPVDPHVRRLHDPGHLHNQVFQPSQGMQRLCDAVPAPACLFLYVHSSSPSILRTAVLISSKRPVTRS